MYLAAHLVWFSRVHRNSVFAFEASSPGVWVYWIIHGHYLDMNNTMSLPLLAPQITSHELLFLMCHVTFLMSHVSLHRLWQGRGMSFCWNELQPDTKARHMIKYLVRKITWSIGLKYQAAAVEGTECSQCDGAKKSHAGWSPVHSVVSLRTEKPVVPFSHSSSVSLAFKTINQ